MKYFLYSSLVFLFVSFVLGQLGRIDISPGLSVSFLDISVFLVVVSGFIYTKKIKIDASFKIFSVFFSICILSLTLRTSQLDSNQLLVSFLYLSRFFIYGMVYFVFREFDKSLKKKITKGMFFSGLLILVLGCIQYFFYNDLRNLYYLGWDEHLYRLFSTFLDPNFAASFLVLYLLFLIGISFNRVVSLFTFLAIFLTFSRSGLIMLVISLMTQFTLLSKKKWILYLLGCILCMILISSSYFNIENMNLFRVASSEARVKSAQEAIVIFSKNPILGVGFNSYRYALISNGFRDKIGAAVSHADAGTDNSFLFVLATTGVVGFGVYVAFWVRVLKGLIKGKVGESEEGKVRRVVMIASIVGVFVDSFFINSLFYPMIMLWMWTLLALTDYT